MMLLNFLQPFFMILGFTFDLFKWIVFILCSSKERDLSPILAKILDRRTNIASYLSISFIISAFMSFEILMLTYMLRDEIDLANMVYDYRNYFLGILNILFLVVYFIVFWVLLRQLKKSFPLYFYQSRRRLYGLSSIIVCGLLVQTVYR